MGKIKKSAAIFLLIICLFGLDKALHQSSSTLSNRISGTLNDTRWSIPSPTDQEQETVRGILNQKFTAIGKGAQFHAFISEDQKYVLKCVKFGKFQPLSWLAHIPIFSDHNPYRRNYLYKQKKLNALLQSCKTAYLGAKEETGMLFLHLNQTRSQFPKVSIVDNKGKTSLIDLDRTPFILQKKAELIYPHIDALMEKQEVEKAKEAITSIFKCFVLLGEKCVCENDPIMKKNFGFASDGSVIQIDIGQFQIQPHRKKQYRRELRQITAALRDWLWDNHRELCDHYDEVLQKSCLGEL